jgi:aspartate/methionine/tyrosine aminotransferase
MGERGEGFFRLSLTADGDDLDLAVERLARVTAASG